MVEVIRSDYLDYSVVNPATGSISEYFYPLIPSCLLCYENTTEPTEEQKISYLARSYVLIKNLPHKIANFVRNLPSPVTILKYTAIMIVMFSLLISMLFEKIMTGEFRIKNPEDREYIVDSYRKITKNPS